MSPAESGVGAQAACSTGAARAMLGCQQQPLSQPQPPLLQPQLLLQQLFPLLPPQQQHRMIIRMMIHRQPQPPPKPLFPQHMFFTSLIPAGLCFPAVVHHSMAQPHPR